MQNFLKRPWRVDDEFAVYKYKMSGIFLRIPRNLMIYSQ